MNSDKIRWVIAELEGIKKELRLDYAKTHNERLSSVHYHIFHAIRHFDVACNMMSGLLPKIEISIESLLGLKKWCNE